MMNVIIDIFMILIQQRLLFSQFHSAYPNVRIGWIFFVRNKESNNIMTLWWGGWWLLVGASSSLSQSVLIGS